jgi:hypothetical protein
MKESGETYASGGGGSSQLGISFEQNGLGTETPGLYRGDMPGGPPTDNQNIDIKNGCLFVNRGRIFGTRLADKTGGS